MYYRVCMCVCQREKEGESAHMSMRHFSNLIWPQDSRDLLLISFLLYVLTSTCVQPFFLLATLSESRTLWYCKDDSTYQSDPDGCSESLFSLCSFPWGSLLTLLIPESFKAAVKWKVCGGRNTTFVSLFFFPLFSFRMIYCSHHCRPALDSWTYAVFLSSSWLTSACGAPPSCPPSPLQTLELGLIRFC